jgi:hypothetical protein
MEVRETISATVMRPWKAVPKALAVPPARLFLGSEPCRPIRHPRRKAEILTRFAPSSPGLYEPALHDICKRGPNRGPRCGDTAWLSGAPQARQAGGRKFEPASLIPAKAAAKLKSGALGHADEVGVREGHAHRGSAHVAGHDRHAATVLRPAVPPPDQRVMSHAIQRRAGAGQRACAVSEKSVSAACAYRGVRNLTLQRQRISDPHARFRPRS